MGAAGLRGESLFRVVRLWRACGPLPQSVLVRATAMSPRADATAELATGSNRCIAVSRRCGVRFRPVIFVGATGGGKTRLAVLIEERLQLSAHRISAHRQLTLNPSVPKIGESHALAGPRVGYASAGEDLGCRGAHPWKSDAAVSPKAARERRTGDRRPDRTPQNSIRIENVPSLPPCLSMPIRIAFALRSHCANGVCRDRARHRHGDGAEDLGVEQPV